MGNSSSQYANRDIVRNKNKTHIELKTRHLHVKHDGFRFLEINNEGSVTNGFTGIGLVGEIFVLITGLMIVLFCLKKVMACRVRHSSYKAFYRAQVADSAYALPVPAIANAAAPNGALPYYGPNVRQLADLNSLADDVRDLKAARAAYEKQGRHGGKAKTRAGTSAESTVYVSDGESHV